LQNTADSTKKDKEQTTEEKILVQKTKVEELRVEWKQLWNDRLNDKVRAEDISSKSYENLKVEQGTIINASRDFKPLNFKEILEQHQVENPDRYIPPNVNQGGWTKFVKTEITKNQQKNRPQKMDIPEKKVNQQPKKGGRGWLHQT
jgi:hypothetical protein